MYLGKYYKASVAVGCAIPLAAVTKQSARAIVGQDHIVITADHNWNSDKLIPYVTLCMNIIETAGKYLYSGGPNVTGRIFVSVHNATTDCSTGLKNIVDLYKVLIKLSIKSRSDTSDQFIQSFHYHVHF